MINAALSNFADKLSLFECIKLYTKLKSLTLYFNYPVDVFELNSLQECLEPLKDLESITILARDPYTPE